MVYIAIYLKGEQLMLDFLQNIFNKSSNNKIEEVRKNIEKIITDVEHNSNCKYSCKDLIMEDFQKIKHRLEEELNNTSDKKDISTIAYCVLFNLTFDNLSMGYYDYHNQSLKNFDCFDNLLNCVKKCFVFFEKNNIMGNINIKIQLNNLEKNYSIKLLTETSINNKKLIVPPSVLAIEKAFFRIIHDISGAITPIDLDYFKAKVMEFELISFLNTFWQMIVVGSQKYNPDLSAATCVMFEEEVKLRYKNIIDLFDFDIFLNRMEYYLSYDRDYDIDYIFLNKFQPIMLFALANGRPYNENIDSRPVHCDIDLTEKLDILLTIVKKFNQNLFSFMQNGSFNSPYEETYKFMVDYR